MCSPVAMSAQVRSSAICRHEGDTVRDVSDMSLSVVVAGAFAPPVYCGGGPTQPTTPEARAA